MSEPAEGPGAPLLGSHRAGYRRVVGAHRAYGLGAPSRGYLFTVALLAGTASMPILAAISAGSATVGNSALPDSSTAFIPTPSVGPVVVPLPEGTQPPVLPSRTPVADATSLPAALAAPTLGDDSDLGSRRRPRPAAPKPPPTRPTPTVSPRPSPSPSPSDPATPDPTPSPTVEPTSTFSGPASDPPTTPSAEPSATTTPDASPAPPSAPPEETPLPTPRPTADPGPSTTAPAADRSPCRA